MKKIKILIGCLFFRNLTGSEMYVFELAKGLVNNNYDVSIVSPNIGGYLTDIALKNGIKVFDFKSVNPKEKYDLIHCQHLPITLELIKIFPITKKICTIHSEVNNLENPTTHFSIFKYIAIRPEIKEYLINNFSIPESMIEVIYNPIDTKKFNTQDTNDNGYLLFVGTIDYLRKNTILDLVEYTKSQNQKFIIVGKNHGDYLPFLTTHPHVEYYDATSDIEKFVKNCSVTAGILLGRTTIEGWLCGKSGWIYDIDNNGVILSKKIHTPPSDIDKFKSNVVLEKIINEYTKILR